MLRKSLLIIYEETNGLNIRWQIAKILMFPIPRYTGGRARAQLMRCLGFQIGQGTLFWDVPILTGGKNLEKRLSIGKFCLISVNCFIDLAAPIRIGNNVGLSPETMLITGAHHTDDPKNRTGQLDAQPIIICDGVWLGARCIVLPGITIGEGAVVGAGAVVTKDVPAHTLVVGVPATPIRELSRTR